jgi:hypothetical protein
MKLLNYQKGYETTFEDTFVIESGDDMTAAEYVLEKYRHLMKKCGGRMFINNDGIWTDDDKQIQDTLFNMVSNLDIRKEGVKNTLVYSRNKTCINNCIDCVLRDNSYTDNNFVDKLFTSNLYY